MLPPYASTLTGLSTSTRQWCAVATTSVAPSTALGYSTFTKGPTPTYSPFMVVYHFENVSGTCENYQNCSFAGLQYQPNPDIGGVGALSAFLITAWVVLIMTVLAYWGGLLPQSMLRNADRICFHANSRHNRNKWKRTFDDIILILSDQQLCFGLGILIAGYYEAWAKDLDIKHWNMVTYLAWLSSTVHLMTLSLIRDRLNENHLLRNIRLAGMLILFVLLLIALVPSTHDSHVLNWSNTNLFPVRCTFGWGEFPTGVGYDEPNGYTIPYGYDPSALDPAVSYTTLVVVYVWKIGQLFDHSAVMIKHYLRDAPRSGLQSWVKRTIPKSGTRAFWNPQHSVAKFFFLLWSVWAEALDSFMATFLALLFALTWGTEQLLLAHYNAPSEIRDGESAWSFGQILTLLLLLQPAMAVVETFSSDKPDSELARPIATSTSELSSTEQLPQHEIKIKPLTKSHTLSSTLSLTADSTMAGMKSSRTSLADPVVAHLYNSWMFKSYIYFIAFCFSALAITVVTIQGLEQIPGLGIRGYIALCGLGGIVGVVPIIILFTWPCSRRLR